MVIEPVFVEQVDTERDRNYVRPSGGEARGSTSPKGLAAAVRFPKRFPRPGSTGEGRVLVVGGDEWACPGRTGRGEAPRPAGPAEMSVASESVGLTGGDAGRRPRLQ